MQGQVLKLLFRLLFLVCLLLFMRSDFACAMEQEPADKTSSVELKPFKVRLVDEASKPVEGAKVICSGLRCFELPGAGCGWPTDFAPKFEYVTDQNGEVEIQYPEKFGSSALWITTSKLIFRFQHADFVSGDLEVDPTEAEVEHTLRPGLRTTFRGVDENGGAVEKFGVLMAGKGAEAIWKLKEGKVSSGGVPKGTWQTMLVAPGAEGRHRFSDLLMHAADPDNELKVEEISLRPGLVARGELSENVPRPIKNGSVFAWCLPKPAGEFFSDTPTLGWGEKTTIGEDGKFEFASLPHSGRFQFFAICDGWVIEGMEGSLVVGNEFDVTEAKGVANKLDGLVLDMARAGAVEVEVRGPDGKPLVGADIYASPNQKMNLYGTTILGNFHSTSQGIETQITGNPGPRFDFNKLGRFHQKTDKDGKAILRDFPMRSRQSLSAVLKDYSMNLPSGSDAFGGIEFECKDATPVRVTVEMQRIEEAGGEGKKAKAEGGAAAPAETETGSK